MCFPRFLEIDSKRVYGVNRKIHSGCERCGKHPDAGQTAAERGGEGASAGPGAAANAEDGQRPQLHAASQPP